MTDNRVFEDDFLHKVTTIIEDNLSDEQFGVSELASKTGMSRSNLLRKIKKLANVSASQFIREVRLKNAMEILRESSYNVSEVTYQVGFGSTSYFIKCFREHYGYPPGEVGKHDIQKTLSPVDPKKPVTKKAFLAASAVTLILIAGLLLYIFRPEKSFSGNTEKSIAVLPFKNDSNDSSNVYFINGIMESVLNNLQKIENLRVISRTSVEKYRNMTRTVSEIAEELNVSYIIEGSGQKIGDKILLHVQLIDAKNDKHLWAEQYNRKSGDVFNLQMEIAKKIAGEIEVIITPEEEDRIQKAPTDDLVAYDFYLKGVEELNRQTSEGLDSGIEMLNKALDHDPEFAEAYAYIAIAYYYKDAMQAEKKYAQEILDHADKALLYNQQSPLGLIAKSLYYLNIYDFELAEPYLKKVLEYNPNSAWTINMLADIYNTYLPNTEKYLEYAIKAIRIDIAANDSNDASIVFLHLANAFIQTGFVEEAHNYINKSLDYDPDNLYSQYVKAYIQYNDNMDLQALLSKLLRVLDKDTSRIDVLQEVAKIYYFQKDYVNAEVYYRKYQSIKRLLNVNVYPGENIKIANTLRKEGHEEEARKYLELYYNYIQNDNSIYRHIQHAFYYAYLNENDKALEHLRLFTKEKDYHYWTVIFVPFEPLFENLSSLPEFNEIMKLVEQNFWNNHNRIKANLEAKGLLW